MHPSLRRRLVFAMLVVFSLAWVFTVVSAYIDSRHETEELMDAGLEQVAKMLLTVSNHELQEELISRGHNSVFPLQVSDFGWIPHHYGSRIEFQVYIDGTPALHSSNAPREPLSKVADGYSFSSMDGQSWRVFALTDHMTQMSVHVGQHSPARDELTFDVALRTLTPLLVVAPVIAVLAWFAISAALRPLDNVAKQVAHREPHDLSPIDTPNSPLETKPLIDSLNRLFARLGTAFENTRRFTADAAHELRTPLAGLAAQNEVALLSTDDTVRTQALRNMKSAIKRMSHLVRQLLTLARWDSQSTLTKLHPVELADVVEGTTHDLEHDARERRIALRPHIIARPLVLGDETGIQLIARNLIDNAIRYTPYGGEVTVVVEETKTHAELKVADTGPGIAPELREQVFRRFYRGASPDVSGSGLGLSIVQRCVEFHGGAIELISPPEGGLTVVVRIPKQLRTY